MGLTQVLHNRCTVAAVQDEPYTEGDGYLDSETGFYDDVYGDYVFDEAEAQTSTCALDRLTGKIQLTGAACLTQYVGGACPHERPSSPGHGDSI
jgi:hypothetical protein